jgi:hypothetical protein
MKPGGQLTTSGIVDFEFDIDARDREQLARAAKRQLAAPRVARPAQARRTSADFAETARRSDPIEIARRAQAQMAESATRGRPLSATEAVLRVMQSEGPPTPGART